jgi:hypothetical protein
MTRTLGNPRQHSPAAMLNILGDVWFPNGADAEPVTPPWDTVARRCRPRICICTARKRRASAARWVT